MWIRKPVAGLAGVYMWPDHRRRLQVPWGGQYTLCLPAKLELTRKGTPIDHGSTNLEEVSPLFPGGHAIAELLITY